MPHKWGCRINEGFDIIGDRRMSRNTSTSLRLISLSQFGRRDVYQSFVIRRPSSHSFPMMRSNKIRLVTLVSCLGILIYAGHLYLDLNLAPQPTPSQTAQPSSDQLDRSRGASGNDLSGSTYFDYFKSTFPPSRSPDDRGRPKSDGECWCMERQRLKGRKGFDWPSTRKLFVL